MKIIKIKNLGSDEYKLVQWKLHNTCNYKCDFCGPRYNGGTERWLDLDIYIKTIDKIIESANRENKKVWFQLTGGEPTLMPNFIEIPKHIKSLNQNYCLFTNGGRTPRWWHELAKECPPDRLILAHHPHQGSDREHISQITNMFHDINNSVGIIVTSPPKSFDQSFDDFTFLTENASGMCQLRGISKLGNKLDPDYTEQQRKILIQNSFVKSKRMSQRKYPMIDNALFKTDVFFDNDTVLKNIHGQKFIQEDNTNFFGWKCTVGQNYLMISHTKIYRGHCGQDGIIGDILDNEWGFTDTPTTCTLPACSCGVEWMQTKWKKS